jgi:hypothetical protein
MATPTPVIRVLIAWMFPALSGGRREPPLSDH